MKVIDYFLHLFLVIPYFNVICLLDEVEVYLLAACIL